MRGWAAGQSPSSGVRQGIPRRPRTRRAVPSSKGNAPSSSRPRPAQGHASPSPVPAGRAQAAAAAARPSFPAAPRLPPPPPRQRGGSTHIRPRPPAGPPGAARGLSRKERRKARSAPPGPGAPPRRPPSRPRGASPRRDPAPAVTTGGGGGGRGATYPPSCGRPLLLGLPGIRGYMERREPGSRGARAGVAARRRDGPAGARARAGRAEGPGLGRGPSGSRTPGAGGRRGPRASPRLARPLRAAPGRPALPPPASLAPGPARRRAHTHGQRRPHAERCDGGAQAAAGPGPCGVCPEPGPGGASRGPARFIGSPASPTASSASALLRGSGVRRPASPPQGCTYVVGDPRPG
ncbi:collagen alpha-1(I) chain-like [Panthera pardus]|uniref:Collagen alpha-1(I) chain-like n=1 Tax=Panthera pardus TaxID=9691 RepID=A0A9W2VGQ7_PANPR|nr:collagen alpha-1(I) chain-like [Panthera pardus]